MLLFIILCLMNACNSGNKIEFYNIPAQKMDYLEKLGYEKEGDLLPVASFTVSNFITYGQYKEYLAEIRQDSSEVFYNSQLPDSNMCLPECYTQYTSSSAFDNDPVVGISWEAAMSFCKWKTIKENKPGRTDFIYRLPSCLEWMAAHEFSGKKPEMNQHYADWLIHSKDESNFLSAENISMPYTYFAKADDPPELKKKLMIGNSFLFQKEHLKDFFYYSYYAFEGYRHISFRMVKEGKNDKKQENNRFFNSVLKYWGFENNN